MEKTDFWKNFELGQELHISGSFIYNGIRRYFELEHLDYNEEIFEVFYNLSVGLERLLKIAVVLLEHSDEEEQESYEKSLITHNHSELLRRIRVHRALNLSSVHNEFLDLLVAFYKSQRYDRFSLSSITNMDKEKSALTDFLAKHLEVSFPESSGLIGTDNNSRYKNFLRKIITKISQEIFSVVRSRAYELNIYTYELRHGSRAETVFLGNADLPKENVLWKELLLFFMNTKSSSGYLEFLRQIEPLDFDPELVDDYLDCFQSDAAKSFVVDELETLYEDVADIGKRLEMIDIIACKGVYFDEFNNESEEGSF